jgi:hypothetical protein
MSKYYFLLLIFIFSCKKESKEPSTNFYYWKTTYFLSSYEQDYISKNNVEKIYIRCFDISLNNTIAEPNGVLLWKQKPLKNIQYIPVVYIENNVFKNSLDVNEISEKVVSLCNQIFTNQQLIINEIQFDCDWTPSTKDNYFAFLKTVKEKNKSLKLSNTLRMYQYKYPEKTGVAPTDYATLMCYNIGDLKSENKKNSILNIEDLKSYLNHSKKYSKKLNVALPIFEWNLIYNSSKQLKKISYQTPNFDNGKWVKISDSKFKCIENYLDEQCQQYFNLNDEIQIEKITKEVLTEATTIIKNKNINTKNEIIYFDLDSSKIQIFLP